MAGIQPVGREGTPYRFTSTTNNTQLKNVEKRVGSLPIPTDLTSSKVLQKFDTQTPQTYKRKQIGKEEEGHDLVLCRAIYAKFSAHGVKART